MRRVHSVEMTSRKSLDEGAVETSNTIVGHKLSKSLVYSRLSIEALAENGISKPIKVSVTLAARGNFIRASDERISERKRREE
jgi:hypothetical protein